MRVAVPSPHFDLCHSLAGPMAHKNTRTWISLDKSQPQIKSFKKSIIRNKLQCSKFHKGKVFSSSDLLMASVPLLPPLFPSIPKFQTLTPRSKHKLSPVLRYRQSKIFASISSPPRSGSTSALDDLVTSILSKVEGSDRGVLLTQDGHKEVVQMAQELSKYCVEEPVKSPLIFGEWDVMYCSNPTSPGGGYRSAIGRFFFKTNEMVQTVEAPDIVKNRVSLTAFGFLDGEVSLRGKLKVLDGKWIQVIFEPPELKVGALDFRYGGESEVKLEITYIDEKIRLGVGSRGSLFVFQRQG